MEKAPASYREIWDRKPVLRAVYGDIYRRMLAHVVPGPILEVGGGSGNFKLFAPAAISSDILPAPWLDLVCDAQQLPFADASFGNIVMVDVLHHIASPLKFLIEAARVLRADGRVILCEPAITPLSGPFYRRFHDEPADMSADPLAARPATRTLTIRTRRSRRCSPAVIAKPARARCRDWRSSVSTIFPSSPTRCPADFANGACCRRRLRGLC